MAGEAGVRSVGAGHLMALTWEGFRLSLVGPPSSSRRGGIRNGEVENHRPGPDCSVLMAVEAMLSFAERWLSEVGGQHCCTIVHFFIPCHSPMLQEIEQRWKGLNKCVYSWQRPGWGVNTSDAWPLAAPLQTGWPLLSDPKLTDLMTEPAYARSLQLNTCDVC